MIRAVLDTNILISAILFKGVPGSLLEMATAGSFRPVTSPTLLDELDEKLRGKFQLPTADTIVSGDRHLLKLGSYDGIQILTVRQFMDKIDPAT